MVNTYINKYITVSSRHALLFPKIYRNFLLVQLTPLFPSNPLLHEHTKLPITSVQVAFTWQLSVSSSHSSMSACRDGFYLVIHTATWRKVNPEISMQVGEIPFHCKDAQEVLTCAVDSISFKIDCCMCICIQSYTNHISTGGIHMAVMYVQFILMSIRACRMQCNNLINYNWHTSMWMEKLKNCYLGIIKSM